jgi:hypothetical protein
MLIALLVAKGEADGGKITGMLINLNLPSTSIRNSRLLTVFSFSLKELISSITSNLSLIEEESKSLFTSWIACSKRGDGDKGFYITTKQLLVSEVIDFLSLYNVLLSCMMFSVNKMVSKNKKLSPFIPLWKTVCAKYLSFFKDLLDNCAKEEERLINLTKSDTMFGSGAYHIPLEVRKSYSTLSVSIS